MRIFSARRIRLINIFTDKSHTHTDIYSFTLKCALMELKHKSNTYIYCVYTPISTYYWKCIQLVGCDLEIYHMSSDYFQQTMIDKFLSASRKYILGIKFKCKYFVCSWHKLNIVSLDIKSEYCGDYRLHIFELT